MAGTRSRRATLGTLTERCGSIWAKALACHGSPANRTIRPTRAALVSAGNCTPETCRDFVLKVRPSRFRLKEYRGPPRAKIGDFLSTNAERRCYKKAALRASIAKTRLDGPTPSPVSNSPARSNSCPKPDFKCPRSTISPWFRSPYDDDRPHARLEMGLGNTRPQ